MNRSTLIGYEHDSARLIDAFEAISSAEVLAPVSAFVEGSPGRVLDVGAGTGRDAAWLAARGWDVIAVEPVAQFREAGARLHPAPSIEWVNDSLPHLSHVLNRQHWFSLVLLTAVWQHVLPEDRSMALRNLKSLLSPSGRLIMSLRHGPGSPARECFPATEAETRCLARECGLETVGSQSAPSVQSWNRSAGVSWTWLVFSHL
jgi:2-polyprenyl-3-methyl-5-hydroxy-6-metoxy-1,4-benzoquinol methylase